MGVTRRRNLHRWIGGTAAAALLLLAAPGRSQEEAFHDRVTVREVSVVLRVVDSHGAPVLGLEPGDLSVRVGGEEVPVASLTWHSSDRSTHQVGDDRASPEPSPTVPRAGPEGAAEEAGALVVVFVQMGHHSVVTLDESWVGGYMKVLPSLRRLVHGLPPRDRVAVVSYDSRLKLRQDFSLDREATAERLADAIGFGEPQDLQPAPDGPSLLEAWDAQAARRTSSPEEGLQVLAEALEPLPGPKDVIFVGWGLGRFTAGFVTMPPVYHDAVRTLLRAATTVHGLNVVEADGNALSAGVSRLAATTGGTYAKTFDFGRTRVERLGRVLTGHYLLTLDLGDHAEVQGYLQVSLREAIPGRDVRIHHRRLRVGE